MSEIISLDQFITPESLVPMKGSWRGPTLMLSSNGQFRFNGAATKILATDKVAVSGGKYADGSGTKLVFRPAKDGDKITFALKRNQKTNVSYFSAAALLRAVGYNYKESGNQVFDLVEANGALVLERLPAGTIGAKKAHA
jgi:hypothetical protein